MAIPIPNEVLVAASVAAAGSQAVTRPDGHHVHRFFISMSLAANVQIQASHDGLNWVDLLAAAITVPTIVELDRPWRNLRAEWDTNTGTVTIGLERLYSNPNAQAV